MMKQAILGVLFLGVVGGAWAAEERVYSTNSALLEGAVEMARTSTVYSVDFKNLGVYLVIGALILVGFTGLGTGVGFAPIGRSSDDAYIDTGDLLFVMTYLVSDGLERFDCLNRLACLDDNRAEQLLVTSRMMIKGAKYFQPFFGYSVDKYEKISDDVLDAILYRQEGGSCNARYTCPAMPSL